MLFYQMGNGKLIPVANRGTSRKEIKALQNEEWVKHQGGICVVISYTEPRAIYFATKEERR
ncbi:hypothetical protein LCGC14_0262500 [marine sediment metagenome]|uniref:Uncharacterized protein n=1 Tax=marine sediment metagenome TaxID=412755 RepID=A0A0F9WLQ4_9ZZZZ